VPLPHQVLTLLNDLKPLTPTSKFLFPSLRSLERPISENAANAPLRRLGNSKDEMCGRGLRALASTCLNEQSWHPDLIELQPAPAERNKVRTAYKRAQPLAQRRQMMQSCSLYS